MADRDLEETAEIFCLLAEIDFRGASPLYDRLAHETSADPEVLSLVLPAAPSDRFPHLLFAAVSYQAAVEGSSPSELFNGQPFGAFRDWCLARRPEIEALVATRVVQTNEVGRCAALAPTLGLVAEVTGSPLAVIEVGASAGLNLCFDRYRYVYGHTEAGPADAEVVLRPRLQGDLVPPSTVPEVTWRLGLDRLPLDVTDDDAVRWLHACIWPEQRWRAELLEQAVAEARRDPPTVVAGDAVESLSAMVAQAPADAALCIVHTAFLAYLPDPRRLTDLLAELARDRPLWWVTGEPDGLVPGLTAPPASVEGISFVYGWVPLGGPDPTPRPVARAGTHGAWLTWLDPGSAHGNERS